jgi:hypothetical protein
MRVGRSDRFPIEFDGLEVVFGRTRPDVHAQGYSPEQPIIEVLADIGLLVEPEGWWMRNDQDPSSDFYVVILQSRKEEPG